MHIDDVMAYLRKTNDFLYLIALQFKIEKGDSFCASSKGIITYHDRALIGEACAEYNTDYLSKQALAFIMAHEIVHIMLSHCEATPKRVAAELYNPYAAWLATETHCNWVTTELIGYSAEQVIKPKDPSKPVWTYLNCNEFGFDPKNMTWVEIFEKIKDDPRTKKERPNTDYLIENNSTSSLSTEKLTQILNTAAGLASGKLPDSISSILRNTEKKMLPWSTLLRHCSTATVAKTPTWNKPSKKGVRIKGYTNMPKVFRVLLYFDTSLSVPETLINEFFAGLTKISGLELDIATYTTTVDPVKSYKTFKEGVTYNRGGTSFKAVEEHWKSQKGYDLAINLTDGWDEIPKERLPKFVWLIHSNPNFNAPNKVFKL